MKTHNIQLEILGSGTSYGIPVIGCNCKVCTSSDKYDIRYRSSAWIHDKNDTSILIDCGPEFRLQALRSNISKLDAVLLTHAHADHCHGMDDLRIFTRNSSLPIYLNKSAKNSILTQFSYTFKSKNIGGGIPNYDLIETDSNKNIIINGMKILPIPMLHGKLETLGWRIGNTAYLTDCNKIPYSSYHLLNGIENLIIDALRIRSHNTHFSFSESLKEIEKIGAKNAWFTHICHYHSHKQIKEFIEIEQGANKNLRDKKIEPAFDRLCINISL